MRQKVWSEGRALPSESEKKRIIARCDALAAQVLKPRFLPRMTPARFNYCVDIYGKWHGGRYRFIQRYRSGFPENRGSEFEASFTRLDYRGRNRFDVMWHRHTGQWWPLYRSVSLVQALRLIEEDGHLHPH
jgi:hypothetical protein